MDTFEGTTDLGGLEHSMPVMYRRHGARHSRCLAIRPGGPMLRVSGANGEISFERRGRGWRIWRDVKSLTGPTRRVEVPWPDPKFIGSYGAVYCLDDALRCLAGDLDEPKNSGRRVAQAIEVEIALKLSSARGGERVELPLADRSLGLNYAWFR